MATDHEDYAAHPEWFDLEPMRSAVPEGFENWPPAVRDMWLYLHINPPVILRRKPVPFVLCIRGAG